MLWAMRAPPGRVWPRWLLGSMLLGLAVGAKWVAVPFIGYAGAALLIVRLNDARLQRRSIYVALNGTAARYWPELPVVPALLALGAVSLGSYVLTFAPAFHYAHEPMTLGQLVAFHARMYANQTQILPSHPYQSSWWSWPLMIRPIWYLYEPVDGAIRGVLMIGNPAIFWGGLIAVLACFYGWLRDGAPKLLGVAALWVGSYAVWIIIPKSIGFFYYYFLPSIFLCVAIAAAFDRFGKGWLRQWDEVFLVLAVFLFAYFYPVLSAQALPGPQAFQHWMWFSTWP
jgi:dolichyl-phosphate-mannose-protein mannosyltransferase